MVIAGCLAVASVSARAETTDEIRGRATVIDAGTIEIGGARIRLADIAAPAERETCIANGAAWNCGQQASWAQAFALAEHWVTCSPRTRAGDLLVARCTIGGAHDIAETLLRQGWARTAATSPARYKAAEDQARQARVGLWR
jgi:endonuclease YncB( thermonuclease family)